MARLSIPIVKGGSTVEVDTDVDVPDNMLKMIFMEGLKVVLNKGMSKVKGPKACADDAERAIEQSAAMKIANERLEKLRAGTLPAGRTVATKSANGTKVPAAVLTEARRLAKEIVKNEIRAAGMRISAVPASEITKIANGMIEADPSYIEQAKANVEAREIKVEVADGDAVAIAKAKKEAALANLAKFGGLAESPALVAKAEKAKKDKPLSAKQAGKTAPRKSRGDVQASAH